MSEPFEIRREQQPLLHKVSDQEFYGGDFVEAMDVAGVHAEILQSPETPERDRFPGNVLATTAAGLVLLVACVYFGRSMALPGTILEGQVLVAGKGGGAGGAGAEAPQDPPEVAFFKAGKKGYALNCQSCHQANGLGAPGQYPPLAGSEWVLESDQRLAAILIHSIEGPLKVKGVDWNNSGMPAWGKTMTDTQIAQIMTFIRGNKDWGNNAPAVTPETVKAVRARFAARTKPWSQAELDAEKWDAAP